MAPELDLRALPAELQAALDRVWPGCLEAQRRALLAPPWLGGPPIWPGRMWAWRPAGRWWRTGWARAQRARDEGGFGAHLGDARGEPHGHDGPLYPERLFDPEQPFFPTPWTRARALLLSPAPEAFSDADFWIVTQRLFGGDAEAARREMQSWARGMQTDRALLGGRRRRWLADAQWRLHMSATGSFT